MGKMLIFNWLAPVRLNWMFRWTILKLMLVIVGWSISCEIDLRSISLDLTVSMEGNGLVPSGNPFWIFIVFIRPFEKRTYYAMAMSVRLSVRPSVRPSFPDFFSTCFEISIWNLVYAFSRWHDMSSLSFITIGSLWPSLQPKVGQTQFLQSWPYKSR